MQAASAIGSVDKAQLYFNELQKNKWLESVAPFDYYLRICEKTGTTQ